MAIMYYLLEDAMCRLIAECVSLEVEVDVEVDCHGSKFEAFFNLSKDLFSISITKALVHLKKSNTTLSRYRRCSLMNPT